MKTVVAAALLAVLAATTFGLVYAYTRPARFQLVPASVPSSTSEKEEARLFLLDTSTGRVWSYSPTIITGQEYLPENFNSVQVAGLHGPERMRNLRSRLEDLKEWQALKNSKELQEYQELKKAEAASH